MTRHTCRECRHYADPGEPTAVCCSVPPRAVFAGWRDDEPIMLTLRPEVQADEPACSAFAPAGAPVAAPAPKWPHARCKAHLCGQLHEDWSDYCAKHAAEFEPDDA